MTSKPEGDVEKPDECSIHVAWLGLPAALFLLMMYQLGAIGPGLLVLICVPNLLGVHMLLSWQWAIASVVAELADVPYVTSVLATAGYTIVGCPYYSLTLYMVFRMGTDLPERVQHSWAKWVTGNLLGFGEESLQIVNEVLRRRNINRLYKLVFLQFDLLCHLLPMLISLQRHALSITPLTCVVVPVTFFIWAGCVHRCHWECVRIHDVVATGRLCFRRVAHGPLLDHMQHVYLLDPPASREERNLAVAISLSAKGMLLFLTATGQHSIIQNWLALGGAVSLDLLKAIYGVMLVTLSVTLSFSFYKIFLKETCVKQGPERVKKIS
mmetsp:Transcript_47761/g.86023  ORF Transcript_47761/g.86023 Transcript_47761/m.86023 type:complete len:325 (-) Transcript_47761:41-1015(-)